MSKNEGLVYHQDQTGSYVTKYENDLPAEVWATIKTSKTVSQISEAIVPIEKSLWFHGLDVMAFKVEGVWNAYLPVDWPKKVLEMFSSHGDTKSDLWRFMIRVHEIVLI